MKMNIAQALRRIKKLKGRMGELSARAAASVSYDVTRKPAFDFRKTRDEVAAIREELVTLEASVARANAVAEIECDERRMTVAEAIRRLQECKAEMAWLGQLGLRSGVERRQERDYDEATGRSVLVKHETEYAADLSEVERAAELETLRGRFERLNDAVEAANHRTPVDWREPEKAPAA
jgi:hypothetical protein